MHINIKTSRGEIKIGLGYPVFIIVEAGSNYGGSLKRAKKMINAAADAGADAVKFQLFKAKKIAAGMENRKPTKIEIRERIQTRRSLWAVKDI